MNKSYKRVAIEAALKSGLFIKNSLGKVKRISYKGRINIVTDVDERAQELIIEHIRSAFPDHSFLSEEGVPEYSRSSYKWVIDPLDGTTNFLRAFPFFCVSIALEIDGAVKMGVVYDPLRDELFYAEDKKGAWLNNRMITVSKVKILSDSLLATGFAYGIKETHDTNIRNFEKFLMRALAIRRAGSAALDFCYVACGRFDGFWELGLHPWDSAAGVLIVREAKGVVTRFDGSRFSHYDKEVLATNGLIHKQMMNVLSKK